MAVADETGSFDAATAKPATLARIFGWGMIGILAVFLINNVLTFWYNWPGISAFFGSESADAIGLFAVLQALFYLAAIGLAVFYVTRTPDRLIRHDGHALTNFNRFLIRSAFWVVVLVGMADMALSFLRVEGLLPVYFSEEIASGLNKSNYRGFYVHAPLTILGILIGAVTRGLGFIWLALLVVVAELLIVLSRFIFSYEQAFMADLVRFWYAALFLFASAYTLLEDGHVRVDVFYAGMTRRKKATVNAWGAILLGTTLCWTILLIGMWSDRHIINAPLLNYETTQTGFGMYVKYYMAGFLAVFATTMMIEFIASFFDAQADRRGEPGHKDHEEMMVG